MSTASQTQNVRRSDTSALPKFPFKPRLICGACGRRGKYDVGSVLVDPDYFKKGDDRIEFEEAISFTGYFRCRGCGSAGPWELPLLTSTSFHSHLAQGARNPQEAVVIVARMQRFDGTRSRNAAESEEYLQSLIEQRPEDGFLWSRLGNLYEKAGMEDQAVDAFSRAVALDPADVESHHSLGCCCHDRGELRKAAEHFHQVIRHARDFPRNRCRVLREIVQDTYERLFAIHMDTDGQIDFYPKAETPPKAAMDEDAAVVQLFTVELPSDEGFAKLASICLGEPPTTTADPDVQTPSARLPASPSSPPESSARIGRNQLCPCGSGKKYKRCCGRRR